MAEYIKNPKAENYNMAQSKKCISRFWIKLYNTSSKYNFNFTDILELLQYSTLLG